MTNFLRYLPFKKYYPKNHHTNGIICGTLNIKIHSQNPSRAQLGTDLSHESFNKDNTASEVIPS